MTVNPLNAELNPIRHLLALVGARHIVHVSRVRVKQRLPWNGSCQGACRQMQASYAIKLPLSETR